jgi:hypothetical protein
MDLAAAAWTPQELLDLLYAWDDRKVFEETLAEARAEGNAIAADYAEQGLAEVGDVTALDALRVTERLAQTMAARQPGLVADARAAGASWAEVGAALGLTRQAAWSAYRTESEPEPDLQSGPRS